jgi:hypothetical protein
MKQRSNGSHSYAYSLWNEIDPRVDHKVNRLLGHVADVVELDDDGLCCGAGGAYSAVEPELAGAIRQRKVEAIARATSRSGARTVASATMPRRPRRTRPNRTILTGGRLRDARTGTARGWRSVVPAAVRVGG